MSAAAVCRSVSMGDLAWMHAGRQSPHPSTRRPINIENSLTLFAGHLGAETADRSASPNCRRLSHFLFFTLTH